MMMKVVYMSIFALVFAVCATTVLAAPSWPVLKQSQSSADVASMQYLLRFRGYSLAVDGEFGSGTTSILKSFQSSRGLTVDGICGTNCWTSLVSFVTKGYDNAAVQAMQYVLKHKFNYDTEADGDCGPKTYMMIKGFQKAMKLTVDGNCGTTTWQYLIGSKASACAGVSSGVSYVCHDDWLVKCSNSDAHWRLMCTNGCNANQCATKSYHSGALTGAQLQCAMPALTSTSASSYVGDLNTAMSLGSISTSGLRIASFLAQIAHESVSLKYWTELGTGCLAYEWNVNLGNTQAGDGCLFKGRGPIQLTGRANYRAAGNAIGIDLENNPTRAADKDVGFKTAVWFWNTRSLSFYSDARNFDDVTYRVNGGFNGKDDRDSKYETAKDCLQTSVSSGSWVLGTQAGTAIPFPVANQTLVAPPTQVNVDLTFSWWAIVVGSVLVVLSLALGILYRRRSIENNRKNVVIRFLKTRSGLPDNFSLEAAAAEFEREESGGGPADLGLATPLVSAAEAEPGL